MNEDKGWSVDIEEVQRAFDSAPNDCKPRIMVVINPGNPTGMTCVFAVCLIHKVHVKFGSQ